MSLRVQLYGPVDGPTGYDVVTRSTAFQLWVRSIPTNLEKFQNWSKDRVFHPLEKMVHEMTQFQFPGGNEPNVMLNVCLPEQTKSYGGGFNVNYTMFEADRTPLHWSHFLTRMDGIVVPSKSSAEAFVRSGVNANKIVVIPFGIDTKTYSPGINPMPVLARAGLENILEKYPIRFLTVQEAISRKNIEGLLQAWAEEVTEDDGAVLIVKINSHSENRILNFQNMMKDLSLDRRKKAAPIYAFHQVLIEDFMPGLYAGCTHYITASCGEGFGLPEFHAAAMEKDLVVPRHTTFEEFFPEDLVYFADAEKEPAKQSGATFRFYHGANWFRPTTKGLRSAIRRAIDDAKAGKSKGKQLREYIGPRFNTTRFGEDLCDYLDSKAYNVGDQLPTPPKVEITGTHYPAMMFTKTQGNAATCGIADYLKTISADLSDVVGGGPSTIPYVGTEDYGIFDALHSHPPKVFHLQLEYGFHSPQRMALMLKAARDVGAKTVVTMHTVNHKAADHNLVLAEMADAIVVGTPAMKEAAVKFLNVPAERVRIFPLPLTDANLATGRAPVEGYPIEGIKGWEKKKWFDIGYFGFAYHHKGLPKLIQFAHQSRALENVLGDYRVRLQVLSQNPQRDTSGAYEASRRMIEMMGLGPQVNWIDTYLEEKEIAERLSKCHLVALPYNEYGGYAASAAVLTAMKGGTPMVVSDTNFFSDLDPEWIPQIEGDLGDFVLETYFPAAIGKKMYPELVKAFVEQRSSVLQQRSTKRIAKLHKGLYDRLQNGVASLKDWDETQEV